MKNGGRIEKIEGSKSQRDGESKGSVIKEESEI
jgi:hypothetical protein